MNSEDNHEDQSGDAEHEPFTQPPIPSTVTKSKTGEQADKVSGTDKETANELAREIRWVEKASLAVNVALALVGIVVAYIYHGQLTVMQGQLDQMKGGSAQTDRLINETHTLADNAGKQATNAADQARKLGALVDATDKQATALGGQLSIMRDQLETTDRPWITIDASVATPPTYNSGMHIGFDFTITNIGKSPAQNVGIFPELHEGIGRERAAKDLLKLCAGADTHYKLTGALPYPGYIVFPGKAFSQAYILDAPTTQFNENNSRSVAEGQPNSDFYVVNLVICVDYTFGALIRHHQTAESFEVTTPGGMFGFHLHGAESLILSRSQLGRYYAN